MAETVVAMTRTFILLHEGHLVTGYCGLYVQHACMHPYRYFARGKLFKREKEHMRTDAGKSIYSAIYPEESYSKFLH
jgi:hypothetical protein